MYLFELWYIYTAPHGEGLPGKISKNMVAMATHTMVTRLK